MKKYVSIFVVLLVAFPMITFASWWQPQTWSIWSFFSRQKTATTTVSSSPKSINKVAPVSKTKEDIVTESPKIENGINKIIKTITPQKEIPVVSKPILKDAGVTSSPKTSEAVKKTGETKTEDTESVDNDHGPEIITEKDAYPPLQYKPGTVLPNGDITINIPKRRIENDIPRTIKIIKPAQGEILELGKPYEVQWTYEPGDLDLSVHINLVEPGKEAGAGYLKYPTDFNVRRDKNNPHLYKWTWPKVGYDDEGKLLLYDANDIKMYRLYVHTTYFGTGGVFTVLNKEREFFDEEKFYQDLKDSMNSFK